MRIFKSLAALIIITLLVPAVCSASSAAAGTAAGRAPFSDVSSDVWYIDDLQYILKNTKHIFSGYPDGTFRPDDTLTVDMYIKLIVSAMGHNVQNGIGYWASTYISKAIEEEYINPADDFIVKGSTADDPYGGYKKPITRADMALITARALDTMVNKDEYRDPLVISSLIKDYGNIPNKKKSSVVKCYDLGVLSGFPDGEFKPHAILTRAEACAVIRRIIDGQSRKRVVVPTVLNPSPTPVPVSELNRPEKKELGNSAVEVEGIRFDPGIDTIHKTDGVMKILKAEEYVNTALKHLKFYEHGRKARVRGYIPELPDGYIWTFELRIHVNERDDRGYYGGTYTTDKEEQPEYKLPPAGNTFDMPLYTDRDNITGIELTCEIKTLNNESGGLFRISFLENTYSTEDNYGSFNGTYPFDCGSFFEW